MVHLVLDSGIMSHPQHVSIVTPTPSSSSRVDGFTILSMVQILASEGPKGLYKGVVPRLGRVIPGQGIIFMSYERIQAFVSALIEKPTA